MLSLFFASPAMVIAHVLSTLSLKNGLWRPQSTGKIKCATHVSFGASE